MRRIYTRTGDTGETSLVGDKRVPKDSPRVEAYGTVDEALSHVALAAATVEDDLLRDALVFLEHRLFGCASALATPGTGEKSQVPAVSDEDVEALERLIDTMTGRMPELAGFILPGGCETSSRLHVARTVMRRAERRIIALSANEPVPGNVRAFVNRSSDLLFTAARYADHVAGVADVRWDPEASAP